MAEQHDNELRETAQRASRLAEGLPPEVRGHIASEIFRELRAGRSTHAAPAPAVPAQNPVIASRVQAASLGEYLAELGDLSHPVRLAAIASFRYAAEGAESLTSDQFAAAYAEVRAPRPQNLSANLGRCIQRGWLAAVQRDGQHAWRVTARGQQMLAGIEVGEGDDDATA